MSWNKLWPYKILNGIKLYLPGLLKIDWMNFPFLPEVTSRPLKPSDQDNTVNVRDFEIQ